MCRTDECSQSPLVEWERLDTVEELACVLAERGGYLVCPHEAPDVVRSERVIRGYPLDRESASFISVTASGLILNDVVRAGRLFLYDNEESGLLTTAFLRLLQRLRRKCTVIPGEPHFRIFPDAMKRARWLGSTLASPPWPSPFAIE